VLAEAGVRHVFTSAGDPALFTARLHDAAMTVVHVVGSLKGARKALDAGVDALVVEGVEGGGFKSLLSASTMVLLPLVAEHVDLPIIAAGGICDARSAAAAVVLGAEGVQMGTRMLASREAGVHANFKEAIVAADDSGTVLLDIPGNPTMRVLRTGLASQVAADQTASPLLGGVTTLYFDGDMEATFKQFSLFSQHVYGDFAHLSCPVLCSHPNASQHGVTPSAAASCSMVESEGSSWPPSYLVMLLRYLTGSSANPTAACETPAAMRAARSRFPNVIPNQWRIA